MVLSPDFLDHARGPAEVAEGGEGGQIRQCGLKNKVIWKSIVSFLCILHTCKSSFDILLRVRSLPAPVPSPPPLVTKYLGIKIRGTNIKVGCVDFFKYKKTVLLPGLCFPQTLQLPPEEELLLVGGGLQKDGAAGRREDAGFWMTI